jgi:hypothetical protein
VTLAKKDCFQIWKIANIYLEPFEQLQTNLFTIFLGKEDFKSVCSNCILQLENSHKINPFYLTIKGPSDIFLHVIRGVFDLKI